jgi:uncharacterized protein YhbP (UPF0306 family)
MADGREQVDARQIAGRSLQSHHDLQVATVSGNGKPWVFTCWYAANERFQIVFMSKVHRRHSQDILATERVAATAVCTKSTLGEPVQSVTVEGRCHRVEIGDLPDAYERFSARFPQVRQLVSLEKLRDPTEPDFLWLIEPETVVLFDEVNFTPPTLDPRRVIDEW